MNLEKSIQELANEAVPPGAVDLAIEAAAKRHRPGSGVLVALAVPGLGAAAVLVVAFWPAGHSTGAWAAAIRNLKDAKCLHIRFVKQLETIDAWKKGDKLRRLAGLDEGRFNGDVVTNRHGFVSTTDTPRQFGPMRGFFDMDLLALTRAEMKIEGKTAKPLPRTWGGKRLDAYTFHIGDVFTAPADEETGRRTGFKSVRIGANMVTAYVDPATNHIVRLEQRLEYAPDSPERLRQHTNLDDFEATLDYPSDLDDSLFDPPADAVDQKEARKTVDTLLAGKIASATVAGHAVELNGLFFDGVNVYAVWKGCAGDYDCPIRFKLDGRDFGPLSSHYQTNVRCLSSAKCLQPESAVCPFSAMGETVTSNLPRTVRLTLPVFAPDRTRPFRSRGGKALGYHSRCVGEAEFENVPVTRCEPLDRYERDLGLLRHMW